MSMQKNFTPNEQLVGSFSQTPPTFAGNRSFQEWFFLILLIGVGAMGFFYVMNNTNANKQGFSSPTKTEQVTKAGFFVGN